MKLAWAAFWRLFVLLLAFSIAMAILINSTGILADPQLLAWRVSLGWGTFAAALLLSLLAHPNGALYFLWGKKLALASTFWRRFSYTSALLFVCLSIANVLVYWAASSEAWTAFRLTAPIVGLVVLSVLVPRHATSGLHT